MASTMASTLAASRPSEKLGTHSTSVLDMRKRIARGGGVGQPLAGFDLVGDAVELRLGDQMPLYQIVGTCIGLPGRDAARLRGGDAGQRLQLIGSSFVDIQRTLGLEAVNDAFDSRLCILGGFRGGLGGVVPDGVRTAFGGGAGNDRKQGECRDEKQNAFHA